jgi:L,D-transpeptidase YcbB
MRDYCASVLTLVLALVAGAAGAAGAAAAVGAAGAQSGSVAEVLRERLGQLETAGRIDVDDAQIVSSQTLPQIYQSNGFQPFWNAKGLAELRGLIAESAKDGLTPEDYHLAGLDKLAPAVSGSDALAQAQVDILATSAFYLLLYHLYFGKVDPASLHPAWNFDTRPGVDLNIAPLVKEAMTKGDLTDAMVRARPNNWLYEKMRVALAEYRVLEANGGWTPVPGGETLKVGSRGSRVVALRQRLAVSGELSGQALADDTYDEPLAAAVRTFQERHRIAADGVVSAGTLKEINIPVSGRIGQIRVNLERGRWVLHEITPTDLVIVDVAGFQVSLFHNHQVVWRGKAQIGKPYRQTPIFKSAIDHIVFNPTWTVPPGILARDLLPAIRRDPGTLAQKRLEVIDAQGRTVDPASIDWSLYTGRNFPYMLRQAPGPDNSLGLVKIMFPNSHAVYLHDTPSKALFEKTERAFSSGCIRVEGPFELAKLLLNDPANWNDTTIDAVLKNGATRTVRLRTPVPVLVMYWTMDPTAEGSPVFKRDPYDRDPKLLTALDAPSTSADVRARRASSKR